MVGRAIDRVSQRSCLVARLVAVLMVASLHGLAWGQDATSGNDPIDLSVGAKPELLKPSDKPGLLMPLPKAQGAMAVSGSRPETNGSEVTSTILARHHQPANLAAPNSMAISGTMMTRPGSVTGSIGGPARAAAGVISGSGLRAKR